MTGIIDRFEGEFCVVEMENGSMRDVRILDIPAGSKEGDVLIFKDNKIFLNKAETEKRKREIEELMKDMFQ
ncbi:Protein of unknown function DUF3006 [Clostridium cellulovorans 743B]|uniref:Uncharacterized protein n=2 Tax=Clostridium cellulovorans TaxID=1493 RepID=D9SPB1_CLOC7|nr:Protein of unknown function DUF3006 [Clostridium cellulovorans 743B]